MQVSCSATSAREVADASKEQVYEACALVVRDALTEHMIETQNEVEKYGERQVHYLCMEFLVGRSLRNNAYNLGILPELTEALKDMGYEMADIFEEEAIPVWATAVWAVWQPATWTVWPPSACAAPATPSAMNTVSSSRRLRTASRSSCRTPGSLPATFGTSPRWTTRVRSRSAARSTPISTIRAS